MKQYKELLQAIKDRGTLKPAARENMPATLSLFGYQLRHNLNDGFPLLTTKKVNFKAVVTELLWFLRGDTNIKYLVDNGVNIWNEDAYNYYIKISRNADIQTPLPFDDFIGYVKEQPIPMMPYCKTLIGYKLGDCGYQYGKVWRSWDGEQQFSHYRGEDEGRWGNQRAIPVFNIVRIDQIKNLIEGLQNNPESRRHIVTAIDPAHDKDLALYWCHSMFQFNCRPATRYNTVSRHWNDIDSGSVKYILDCHLYQRSADVFLGVPFNIASYALLTHIVAKICNMIPGEFIHSFGDVHIYENHMDAVNEQLKREPRALPRLDFHTEIVWENYDATGKIGWDFDVLEPWEFMLEDYNPHPAIKAELSTGLIK